MYKNLPSSSAEVHSISWGRPRWRCWTVTRWLHPGRGFRSAVGRRRRRGTGPRPRPQRNTGSTAARLRAQSQHRASCFSPPSGILHRELWFWTYPPGKCQTQMNQLWGGDDDDDDKPYRYGFHSVHLQNTFGFLFFGSLLLSWSLYIKSRKYSKAATLNSNIN